MCTLDINIRHSQLDDVVFETTIEEDALIVSETLSIEQKRMRERNIYNGNYQNIGSQTRLPWELLGIIEETKG